MSRYPTLQGVVDLQAARAARSTRRYAEVETDLGRHMIERGAAKIAQHNDITAAIIALEQALALMRAKASRPAARRTRT